MSATNVKYGFVAGAGVIVTPPILSNITLASYGTNTKFVIMGKRADVLKLMDGSSLSINCASMPFERNTSNQQKIIAVQVSQAKKLNISCKPFSVYREIVVALKVFNEHRDIPLSNSCLCCSNFSGTMMTIPSGTSLSQLSNLIKRPHYRFSYQWRPTAASKRDMDPGTGVLLAPGFDDHTSLPTYQAIIDHDVEGRFDHNGQPPSYEAWQRSPPLYTMHSI